MSIEVKPGWKTTEFWMSTLALIVGAVMASGVLEGVDESNWIVRIVGGLVTVLAALGYDASRTKAKEPINKDI